MRIFSAYFRIFRNFPLHIFTRSRIFFADFLDNHWGHFELLPTILGQLPSLWGYFRPVFASFGPFWAILSCCGPFLVIFGHHRPFLGIFLATVGPFFFWQFSCYFGHSGHFPSQNRPKLLKMTENGGELPQEEANSNVRGRPQTSTFGGGVPGA